MRLLPLLIMVAMLAFAVRVGEITTGIKSLSGVAVAEEKPADAKEAAKAAEDKPAATEDGAGEASSSNAHSSMPKPEGPQKETILPADAAKAGGKSDDVAAKDKEGGKSTASKPSGTAAWPDASDMDPDLAKVKSELYKDLATRRKQLEDREKQLLTREAVLKAAEAEIDQKYQEMTGLQNQLKQLLETQSSQETDRMKSLVKIYEGMKPADAARILNTLDLKILLDVISQMSERKSSPILAAMDPDRARVVTLMLAQQKKLPELPQLIEPQAGGDVPGTGLLSPVVPPVDGAMVAPPPPPMGAQP